MVGGSYGHFPRRNTGKPSDDANEDEDELLEWDLPATRDTVLWLIDAGTKMHDQLVPLSERAEGEARSGGDDDDVEEEENSTPRVSLFHKALQAAYLFQRSKLVNSPADHCGILLFNTEKTDVLEAGKNVAYPNSITVQTINQVAVPPISEIKDDLQNSLDNGPSYFREKYKPNSRQSRIHHALGNAEAMMLAAGKSGSKRIFYVTNEDDPMGDKKGKTEQQRLALEKVKSMIKRGIEFEPFLVSSEDNTFETVHFYGDLFCAYADEGNGAAAESIDGSEAIADYNRKTWNATIKFDHLEQEIGTRETPKRVIFSVPMTLGKDVTIGVKGYCTIVKATKGLPVRVMAMEREDEDDPIVYKEIITETTLNCADTGRELDKDRDVDYAFAFGSENNLRSKVRFSQMEMQKLRTFGQEPSIKIIGFKPFRELHFHENLKHAYFIYPFDLVSGSWP
jgi:ATP-dependent DNA helicase 2 subunit 1